MYGTEADWVSRFYHNKNSIVWIISKILVKKNIIQSIRQNQKVNLNGLLMCESKSINVINSEEHFHIILFYGFSLALLIKSKFQYCE